MQKRMASTFDSRRPLLKRIERSFSLLLLSLGRKLWMGGTSCIWGDVIDPMSEGLRCDTMSGFLQTLDIWRPISRPDAELPIITTFCNKTKRV